MCTCDCQALRVLYVWVKNTSWAVCAYVCEGVKWWLPMLSALNTCLARAHSNVWQPLDDFLSIFRSQLSMDLCVCFFALVCECTHMRVCVCVRSQVWTQASVWAEQSLYMKWYKTFKSYALQLRARAHKGGKTKLSAGISHRALFCHRISATVNFTCNRSPRVSHTLTQTHIHAQTPKGLGRSSGNERIIWLRRRWGDWERGEVKEEEERL